MHPLLRPTAVSASTAKRPIDVNSSMTKNTARPSLWLLSVSSTFIICVCATLKSTEMYALAKLSSRPFRRISIGSPW